MKRLIFLLAFIGIQSLSAQSPDCNTPVVLPNGDTQITGVDPFGAQVTVVYNTNMVKIYQERTIDDVTTYVKYKKGQIVEYGTIHKPDQGSWVASNQRE